MNDNEMIQFIIKYREEIVEQNALAVSTRVYRDHTKFLLQKIEELGSIIVKMKSPEIND